MRLVDKRMSATLAVDGNENVKGLRRRETGPTGDPVGRMSGRERAKPADPAAAAELMHLCRGGRKADGGQEE